MPTIIREVDPAELRFPSSRSHCDPLKLARQISQFGSSHAGMPPLTCYESADGYFVVYNGVTRATRIAKLAPGTLVTIEVIGRLKKSYQSALRIGEALP